MLLKKKKYLIICILSLWALLLNNVFAKDVELVQSVATGTESVLTMPDVPYTANVWLDMLNSAKKSIDIGAFYFSMAPEVPLPRSLGKEFTKVIQAINQAAYRGVKIRVLVDAAFEKMPQNSVDYLKTLPNTTVRVVNFKQFTGSGVMHAKYMIIDGYDTFIGSQNFDWRAMDQIGELGVRIKNVRFAKSVTQVFDLDWHLASLGKKSLASFPENAKDPVNKNNPAIIKQNGADITAWLAVSPGTLLYKNMDAEEPIIVSLIDNAKKVILIQVLDFTDVCKFCPDKKKHNVLSQAIRRAAKRGVKIKMIIAEWSVKYSENELLGKLNKLPNVKIRISYLPPHSKFKIDYARVEHQKYMLVDDKMIFIGTGNWVRSYFHYSRNMGIVLISKSIHKKIRDYFMADWNGPYVKKLAEIGK